MQQKTRSNPKPTSAVVSSDSSAGKNWKRLLLGFVSLLLLAFRAYAPALRGAFIWDDSILVTEDPFIQSPSGIGTIWFSTRTIDYFPLTLTSFWLEWFLWGNNPLGYHVVNVVLHGVGAALVWRVLRELKIPGAWFCAAIFTVHPVTVQSVASIAERKNTLSLVFYALSLFWFLKWEGAKSGVDNLGSVATSHENKLPNSNPPGTAGKLSKFYWLSLGAFLLALLSKTSVVMLPFVLLGCVWWRRGTISRQDIARTTPFFVLALILGLVTIWFQTQRNLAGEMVYEKDFWGRLAGAGWAVWFYLSKILWPINLAFFYPRWDIDSRSLLSYLPGVAVVAVLALGWFFRPRGGRAVLFAFGYFVITLFPVLGFFDIKFQKFSLVTDCWQYLPMIGIIAFVVGGACHWLMGKATRITPANRSTARFAVFALSAIVLIGLLGATRTKAGIYHDAISLWRDSTQKNPESQYAQCNYVNALMVAGHLDEAAAHAQKVLEQKPGMAEMHFLLGSVLMKQNNIPAGEKEYSAALELSKNFPEAHYQLGQIAFMRNDPERAIAHFKAAVELKPNYLLALNSLARIFSSAWEERRRNGAEAVRLATRAVEISESKDPETLDTLAAALAEAGRFDEAVFTAEKAAQLATSQGNQAIAAAIAQRRDLYHAHKPFHISNP